MFSYFADQFIDNVAEKLAIRPIFYDERESYVGRPSSESEEALTVLDTVLEVWEIPATFCNGKPMLEIPPNPLWFIEDSPALDWRKLRTLKDDTTPGRRIKAEPAEPMDERLAFGPDDDGKEATLLNWIWPSLERIICYSACLNCEQLQNDPVRRRGLTNRQLNRIYHFIDRLRPITRASSANHTAPNLLVPGTIAVEIEPWATFTAFNTEVLDKAISVGAMLHDSRAWVKLARAVKGESTTICGRDHQNTQVSLAQVTESLKSHNVSQGVLTNVFGAMYRYRREGSVLKITKNLNPASDGAQRDNNARSTKEIYKAMVEHLLEYCCEQYHETLDILVQQTLDGADLKIPPKAHTMRVSAPSTSRWFRLRYLAAVFFLAPSVYSEEVIPLPLDGRLHRWVPSIFSHFLDVEIVRPAGNNASVWVDSRKEVIFKKYFDKRTFLRELGFLQRLAGFPWVPRVLGTTSRVDGIWGIFMTHEGKQVGGTWEEVKQFVLKRVKELHIMGIHHHDIAPRNVLRRADGSFVLIDFDNAVDSQDCLMEYECPDAEPDAYFD